MKKVLLTLLTIVVVLGLFAGTGYAGYRIGLMRGAQLTANGAAPNQQIRPFGNLDRRGMPNFGNDFGRGGPRGFGMRGFPMMGMGFGIFSLFGLLTRIAVFALLIWFIYWLFTRSGWRLTRTAAVTEVQSNPAEPGVTENQQNS